MSKGIANRPADNPHHKIFHLFKILTRVVFIRNRSTGTMLLKRQFAAYGTVRCDPLSAVFTC